MYKKPKILVVCAVGAATSALTASRLRDELKEKNIDAEVVTGTISDLSRSIALGVDLIVTPTVLPNTGIDVPVVNTTAFLTYIGVEQALQDILVHLNIE